MNSWKPPVIWLDLETTGLDPQVDLILEIAMVIYQTGKEATIFHCYVKHPNYPSSINESSKIHGLTPEILDKQGMEPQVAFDKMQEWVMKYVCPGQKTSKAILAGYNVKFDIEFLRGFYGRHQRNDLFMDDFSRGYGKFYLSVSIDVMSKIAEAVAYGLFEVGRSYKLSTVANKLGIKYVAHNALQDIMATREVFKRVCSTLRTHGKESEQLNMLEET